MTKTTESLYQPKLMQWDFRVETVGLSVPGLSTTWIALDWVIGEFPQDAPTCVEIFHSPSLCQEISKNQELHRWHSLSIKHKGWLTLTHFTSVIEHWTEWLETANFQWKILPNFSCASKHFTCAPKCIKGRTKWNSLASWLVHILCWFSEQRAPVSQCL